MESEFVIEILAGLSGMLIVAMVLVVALLRPRPAGMPVATQQPKPPVASVKEREPAFYSGVNGVMSGTTSTASGNTYGGSVKGTGGRQ